MKGRRYTLGFLVAIGMLVGSSGAVAAQDDSATTQPPVEFTGQVVCGDQIRSNSSEAGDGASVSLQERGGAWHPTATMSDPRLEGDYHFTFDDDIYASPAGSSVGSATWRIENEEGAWQGSYTRLFIGDRASVVTTPFEGEGAYEGMTVIWESAYDPTACVWDVWGLIIEGEVPAAPEPFSGQ